MSTLLKWVSSYTVSCPLSNKNPVHRIELDLYQHAKSFYHIVLKIDEEFDLFSFHYILNQTQLYTRLGRKGDPLRKKLKFDHTNKWYMHKPESVLSDFEIQTDHLISARQPNLVILNKKKPAEL